MTTRADAPTLRAPSRDEAPAIADFLNERAQLLRGQPDVSAAEIEGWFDAPDLDPERDFLLAARADGELVGYGDIGDQASDGRRFWLDIRVHPERGGPDAREALLDALEVKAADRARPGALVRAIAEEADGGFRALLEARGYRLVRSSFVMEVVFDGELPPAGMPDGLVVRPAAEGEERAVYEAMNEAFADSWDFTPSPFDEWLHWTRSGDFDASLWFVAEDEGEVAGVCLCRPSAHGDRERGWVGTLGVRLSWRRRGLGRALLRHAFDEFERRGLRGAGLGVDAENPTGAVALYERAGMHVARRTDVYERPA